MGKKIKAEEITLKKAWDIAGVFAKFIGEDKSSVLYKFEDVLPYEKNLILFSLVKILTEEDFKKLADIKNATEKTIKENIATMIVFLDGFIPSPDKYKEMIEIKELTDKVGKLGGN